jgi:hypothetical protein
MKNPVTGFGNVTCLTLLTHLRNNYGNITEQELEANILRMQAQWNPPTPIESLFMQIEDGVAFAAEGLDEPTKPTVLRWAYDIVATTGRYDIACREWRQFNPDPKTKNWAKFKSHFKAADRDMRSQDTTGSTGYHGDNVTTTAATNTATLLATTQAALAASKLKLAQALSQASIASSSSRISNRSTNTRVSATTTPDNHPRAYCWTHRHTANLDHSSPTCQYPAEGHEIAATNNNNMGGTDAIFVLRRNPGGPRRRSGGPAKHVELACNINSNKNYISSTSSVSSPPIIMDTGATGHFSRSQLTLTPLCPPPSTQALMFPFVTAPSSPVRT